MLAQVTAAPDLESFETRLRRQLESAKERKERAEDFCRDPNLRRTKTNLKYATRAMLSVVRTLRSRRARKSLPNVLRDELLQAADGIRGDLRTLRGGVRCPDDTG
jgi:hypothetical protein